MKNNPWDKKHKSYSKEDWVNKPSVFAEEVIKYFPKGGKILELGAGQGQDSRFFAENGFDVVSTDISDDAIKLSKEKLQDELKDLIEFRNLDMIENFPFEDESFDIVYAHLSIHYFTIEKTKEILNEIKRVLKKDGIFAMLNNSTSDPEYNTGDKIEDDYFFIEDKNKRFFSVESLKELIKDDFEIILLDNKGETYKDAAKGIHNLIRFVGKKK